METIGQAIRHARVKLRIQQRQLAAELGITPQYLADIEIGRREMPRARIADLPPAIRRAALMHRRTQLHAELAEVELALDALARREPP